MLIRIVLGQYLSWIIYLTSLFNVHVVAYTECIFMSSDHLTTISVYFFQVISIAKLLNTLPEYSSAVITSADSLIPELFTHNGKSQKVTIKAYYHGTLILDEIQTIDLAVYF